MLEHALIEHGHGQYECRVCGQIWTLKPTLKCPGLKVYPRDDYAPLMSKKDLNLNGYQTLDKFLPKPVGCILARTSDDFDMLYDPAQAVKRMTKNRPMAAHDLVKHGPGQYECRVCFKRWDKRPQTACPGLRVYERYDHAPFMTKEGLAYLGYDMSAQSIPPEAGCFYHPSASRYISLYDPIQAIPKTRRGAKAITQILWPLRYLYLLESSYEMEMRRHSEARIMDNGKFLQMYEEITGIASMTGLFTRAEIEQYAGDILILEIPPTPLSRFYPATTGNFDAQNKLQANLVIAYRKHLTLVQLLS